MHTHTGDTGGRDGVRHGQFEADGQGHRRLRGGVGVGLISVGERADSARHGRRGPAHIRRSRRARRRPRALCSRGPAGRWPQPAMSSSTHDDSYSLSEEVAFAMVDPQGRRCRRMPARPGVPRFGPKVADRCAPATAFGWHGSTTTGSRAPSASSPLYTTIWSTSGCRPRRGRRPPARGRPRGGCGCGTAVDI